MIIFLIITPSGLLPRYFLRKIIYYSFYTSIIFCSLLGPDLFGKSLLFKPYACSVWLSWIQNTFWTPPIIFEYIKWIQKCLVSPNNFPQAIDTNVRYKINKSAWLILFFITFNTYFSDPDPCYWEVGSANNDMDQHGVTLAASGLPLSNCKKEKKRLITVLEPSWFTKETPC